LAARIQRPSEQPHQERADQQQRRRQARLQELAALACLRGVPPNELQRPAAIGVFRALPNGAVLLARQRETRFLYLILSGRLQVRLRDRDGRQLQSAELGRGDCFGEGALFGQPFRRMTATTIGDCLLFQVPISGLRETLSATPQLAAVLRTLHRRRLVLAALARLPALVRLPTDEQRRLLDHLEVRHLPRGAAILQQGDAVAHMYIIESGQVLFEQHGQAVAARSDGDLFGDLSLLTGNLHRSTARAATAVDLLLLDGAELLRTVAAHPEIAAELHGFAEQRLRTVLQTPAAAAPQLALALERGLMRATQLLVRDPQRCPPGCRICEQACSSRFGRPRLQLNGTSIGAFDVLDSCRQCQSAAECMAACPVDAFERLDNGALRITDACTGCGACIPACPYGALAAVPTAPPARTDLFSQLWQRLRSVRRQAPVIMLEAAVPTQRADKCDLCADHQDMACISACPIGNLRLAPVEELVAV
jgi:CRP-like cAMP-binding protein/Fe-S-cluster-containing hydrogenase component 2